MNNIYKIVRNNQNSYFWIMQLLPKAQRVAAYTLFAFNYHIEKEIVKSAIKREEKIELLNAWSQEIDNIFDANKTPQTEIGRKIYKNCMRFGLEKRLFTRVVNGYRESLCADLFCPSLFEYKRFCRNVYGAKIEMALKVLRQEDEEISALMANFIHPVVALENMKEDCQMGFVYIPKEFLEKFEINLSSGQDILTNVRLIDARVEMLEYAQSNLKELEDYYPNIEKQSLKLIKGFVNIYKKYLDIMQNRGMEVITPKPIISNFSKLKIILKNMLG